MLIIKSKIRVSLLVVVMVSITACNKKNTVGEKVVNEVCVVCHSQAINGAPIIGNIKMWSKRLPQGEAVLIQHAINGYELMPAKGGRVELSDEEVAAAVRYMIEQVKN